METGVEYCFVKTGLADGYVFIPVITIVFCGSYVAHKACSSGRFLQTGVAVSREFIPELNVGVTSHFESCRTALTSSL